MVWGAGPGKVERGGGEGGKYEATGHMQQPTCILREFQVQRGKRGGKDKWISRTG